MQRADWILGTLAIGMGICCLLLAATGLSATSSFLPPAVRSALLTWAPPLSILCILGLGLFVIQPSERMVAMPKRLLTVLAVLAAAAVVAALSIGLTAAKRLPAGSEPAAQAAGPYRVSDAGGVQVRVGFDPGENFAGNTVSFSVVLDTHSVDLGQFDLGALSRISLDPGGALTDLAWQPKGDAGGHHVEGTLSARAQPGALKAARTVSLEIAGVVSQEPRRFQWKVGSP